MAKQISEHEGEIIEQARRYVHQASQLLKSLDGDRARVGWLLDDAMMYLDEVNVEERFDRIDPLSIDLSGIESAEPLERTRLNFSK